MNHTKHPYRLIFEAIRKAAFEQLILPPLKENEVLLQTQFSVISPGTERAFFLAQENTDTHSNGFPFFPGYSNVGKVVQVGKNVQHIQVGELIAAMSPHQSHSIVQVPDLKSPILGNIFDNVAHEQLGWKVPHNVSENEQPKFAAFMLATVALYGLRLAQINFGDRVTIVGLGAIGLMAGQLAASSGAICIDGIACDSQLREMALLSGFDCTYEAMPTFNSSRESLGRHIIVECTGSTESLKRTLEGCPYGATLVLLGCTRGILPEVNFYNLIQRKAITIIGAHQPSRPNSNYLERRISLYRDAQIAIEMINSGKLDTAKIIKLTTDVKNAQEVYDSICQRKILGAVALKWSDA